MPTTFAVGIDENPLYATRAEQDKNGDQIDLTYAKKSEVPSQLSAASGLTIVSDVVGAKVDGTTIIVNQNGELASIGGSGGGDVFYATYGVTTFNEIVTANQAGKAVVLQKATALGVAGYSLPLQNVFISNLSSSSYAYFSRSPQFNNSYGELVEFPVYKVDGNDTWTTTAVYPITYPTSADVGKVLTCSRAGRVSWNEAATAEIHTSTNLKGDGTSSDPLDLNSVIDIGGYPETSHHTYINDEGVVSAMVVAPEYYDWSISPISGLSIFSKYDEDGTTGPINRLIGRDIIALHGIETSASIWNEAAAMDEYPISAGPGIKIEDVDDVTVFSTDEITAGTGIKVTTPAAGQIQISNDETVLWSGNNVDPSSTTIRLSEDARNFERIRFYWGDSRWFATPLDETVIQTSSQAVIFMHSSGSANAWIHMLSLTVAATSVTVNWAKNFNMGSTTSTTWSNPTITTTVGESFYLSKIVGINRISGGN